MSLQLSVVLCACKVSESGGTCAQVLVTKNLDILLASVTS